MPVALYIAFVDVIFSRAMSIKINHGPQTISSTPLLCPWLSSDILVTTRRQQDAPSHENTRTGMDNYTPGPCSPTSPRPIVTGLRTNGATSRKIEAVQQTAKQSIQQTLHQMQKYPHGRTRARYKLHDGTSASKNTSGQQRRPATYQSSSKGHPKDRKY